MSKLYCAVAMALSGLSTPALAQSAFSEAARVEDSTLNGVAGREDINQLVMSQQKASVSGSSVNGTSTTGAVQIDGSAFQNLSGLSVISANSGNNVAINTAMNVNITLSAN